MTRILQIGPLSERFNQALATEYQVTALWLQADPQAFLREQGEQFEVVATSARFGLSTEQMALLPKLKAVCSFGVGYDSIAVDQARDRGIPVSTTPDVLTDCVADLAMGMLIDVSRRIAESDRFVRSGKWEQAGFPLAMRVSGMRLGIVGLGSIGQAIARRAGGFDMPVRYHSRRPVADSAYTHEADLQELARWADFLVVACPGGDATRNLVNAPVLEALGPKGYLINIARGSVVDEPALINALQQHQIAGAALDVFAKEPNVPQALRDMNNVLLLPHVGSATVQTRQQMEDLLTANIKAFIESGKLLTPL
ncbi:2-hydroxyacid dehydrogenase [Pseudomonas sp. EL_65y_Pfl2_R95]|uniref:2-hydroxyacid dehydrogenase n=1 Tax=Pseudomonas sp. EL_65y_Pfl2_R95 TaxID=3088698 RepID=UPI0030DC17AA